MSIITKLGIKATTTTAARQAASTEGAFTKEALHSPEDRAKVGAWLRDRAEPWLRVFWLLSIETGWRTGDVCRLSYRDFDLAAGSCEITVAKQTKAAQARAARAVVMAHIDEARELAALAGEIPRWQRLGKLNPEQYLDTLAGDERDSLLAEIQAAADNARPKIDTKQLSPQLVAELRRMQAENAPFDFVFDRRILASNRAAGVRDGENEHISRQCVWRKMRDVFQAALNMAPQLRKVVRAGRELLVKVMRYSAYSSRKTSLSLVATAAGKVDLAAAASFIGHADTKVTERYVMPGLKQGIPAGDLAAMWA